MIFPHRLDRWHGRSVCRWVACWSERKRPCCGQKLGLCRIGNRWVSADGITSYWYELELSSWRQREKKKAFPYRGKEPIPFLLSPEDRTNDRYVCVRIRAMRMRRCHFLGMWCWKRKGVW